MASVITLHVDMIHTADSVDRDVIPAKVQTIATRGDATTGGKPALGVAQEALNMGEVIVGGWWKFVNRSTTTGEVITIQSRTAGGTTTNMLDLLPGEEIAVRLSAAMDELYAVSAAGTPQLEYFGTVD